MLKKAILCLLSISATHLTNVHAVQYTISEISILKIPESSMVLEPTHLNNNGTIAGQIEFELETIEGINNVEQGFVLNSGFHIIANSSKTSQVTDINDHDQVVGEADDKAFIWEEKTGMVLIDTPFSAIASSINNLGNVVVFPMTKIEDEDGDECIDFSRLPKELYLWNMQTGLTQISTENIFSKNQFGFPTVINDNNQVLLNIFKFDSNLGIRGEGFCVLKDGKVIKQENGFREVYKSLYPVSMNNNGDVACMILAVSQKTGAITCDSIIYTGNGKKINISKKSKNVEVLHLNDQMQAVGNLGTGKLDDEDEDLTLGFIWDEKNGIQDLNTLIKRDVQNIEETSTTFDFSTAVIRSALQINNKGQILVTGETEYNTFNAILTPVPE